MNQLINNLFSKISISQNTLENISSIFPMLIFLIIFTYLTIFRPQSKKVNDHKKLIDNLQVGDEIITIGGIIGCIERITQHIIILNINENINIIVQKNAISCILPKGTIVSYNKK